MSRHLLAILTLAVLVAAPAAPLAAAPESEASQAVFIAEKPVLFGALKAMVETAKRNVFVRIFVISDNDGVLFSSPEDQPPMAQEFADLLIRRKQENPGLDVVVILDPINFVDYHQAFEFPWQRWAAKLREKGKIFRGLARRLERLIVVNRVYPERFEELRGKQTIRERMRDAGITVLSSNLLDNPEHSFFFKDKQGRDEPAEDGDNRMRAIRRLRDEYPAIGDRLALERKLALFQAYSLRGDHRKFAVIDDGELAWNSSMNVWDNDFHSPDDGVVCSGALARDMLAQFEEARRNSLALYEPLFRAGKLPELAPQFARDSYTYAPQEERRELRVADRVLELEPARGRLLRDGAIASYLADTLRQLEPGSEVDVYQTLITDKKLIEPIAEAARRGVKIRLITDAYENVYGHDVSFTHGVAFKNFRSAMKDGASLEVRAVVPDPRISEIHRKFTLVRGRLQTGEKVDALLTGSANFTVHSADGSQLELDVLFTEGDVKRQARDWFERAWSNQIESEKNFVPRLIREHWNGKDVLGTGVTWFLSVFGLGG